MSPLELPKIDNCTHFKQICPKAEGPHLVGPQEGQPFSKEGSAMPQAELWQMQQGSVLEDGKHSPCHLQRQAQDSEQMGEQGVCDGMVALSKPTSICSTSHRRGVKLYPAEKIPVANQQQSGKEEGENSVRENGLCDEPTPVPQENDALPVKCLTESQLEGFPNSPSKWCKLFDSGLTSTDPTDRGLQTDNDAPVPPR